MLIKAGLKACPFCGNDGSGRIEDALHVIHEEPSDWRSRDTWTVQCDDCTATMGYSDSPDEAIEAWNRRACALSGSPDGAYPPCGEETMRLTNFISSLFQPVKIYTKETVRQGTLNDNAIDDAGNGYFGSGNPGTGFDIQRAFGKDGLHGRKELTDEVGLKVHYRTVAELGEFRNGEYHVDGGHQQAGVHDASATAVNRASWNVDFSVYDKDGDFSGTQLWIDVDKSTNEKWLKGLAQDLDNDGDIDAFVFNNGFVMGVGNGNGAEPGQVLQDSINFYFAGIFGAIDNDGNSRNGIQAWDGESGEFVVRVIHDLDQPNPIADLLLDEKIVSEVTVNVGPMLDAMM